MVFGTLHLLVWLQQLLKLVNNNLFGGLMSTFTLGASQLPRGGQFIIPIILIISFPYSLRGVWAPFHLTHHHDFIRMFWFFHHLFIFNAEVVIKGGRIYRPIWPLSVSQMVFTILTALAYTAVCAGHTTLIAFTVFFQASRFLTMAALWVVACVFLDFRLESSGVALHNWLHSFHSLRVSILVAAVTTVAVRPTSETRGKAIAIEL